MADNIKLINRNKEWIIHEKEQIQILKENILFCQNSINDLEMQNRELENELEEN